MKKHQFTFIYLLPAVVYYSLISTGWITFLPILLVFGAVPLVELLIKPDHTNADKNLALKMKEDRFYDWNIYLLIPIHLVLLTYFLFIIKDTPFTSFISVDYLGKVVSIGLMCGVIGINLGHELGHRQHRLEQLLGELLLLTSLDTHFLPYHNGGHHLNVSTPKDAASAKKNQLLYTFWFTSHFGSYIEAWKLENSRLKSDNKPVFSLQNRMVGYSIANCIVFVVIYVVFGLTALISFVFVASIGILLLETVNYIEHYGLIRNKNKHGRYEKVNHTHSWNSDHLLGRYLLFNLSRHSDHHYNGSKKYQLLKSVDTSPQMPTGYPGMMVLSVLQPVWFFIMNRKLKTLQNEK